MADDETLTTKIVAPEMRLAVSIPAKKLSPEAQRALAEAEARRKAVKASAATPKTAREINGRKGPEPTRYGDWESKGIVSDF